jgi:hypothetical protein
MVDALVVFTRQIIQLLPILILFDMAVNVFRIFSAGI